MQREDAILLDIMRAAQSAARFKGSNTKAKFLKDDLLQSGIVLQLINMGEAVKRLSKAFRESHPEVPWKLIAGMRDRLTHGYFDIDLNEVWKTIEKDIPELIKILKPLMPRTKTSKKEK